MTSLPYNPKFVQVEIRKPLFANFCYIRDVYIKKALKEKKDLQITIPQGVGIVSVADWMKNAKIMKKVFLRPDQPMILYGNYVPLTPQIEVVAEDSSKQLELF